MTEKLSADADAALVALCRAHREEADADGWVRDFRAIKSWAGDLPLVPGNTDFEAGLEELNLAGLADEWTNPRPTGWRPTDFGLAAYKRLGDPEDVR